MDRPIFGSGLLTVTGADYLRFNPSASPSDLDNIIKDIETLIERKLKMFPKDKRQIVGATVVKVGGSFRIEVVSATLE